MENWLRNEALPAFDAYKADPQRGLSLENVKTGLPPAMDEPPSTVNHGLSHYRQARGARPA